MHSSTKTLNNAAQVLRISNYWRLADEIVTAISEIERLRDELAIAQGANKALEEWIKGYRIRGSDPA